MDSDENKLVGLISRVISRSYSAQDLSKLIHTCTVYAAIYIRNNLYQRRLYFAIRTQGEQDIEDMALDAIAPLFARDKAGDFYLLIRFFNPLSSNMARDNHLACVFLKRLVISKVKQELAEKFKQEDPAGWRFLRNIKLASQRNSKIGVFRRTCQTYYFLDTQANHTLIPESLKPQLSEIPEENLKGLLLTALKQVKTTPAVIEHVLTVLRNTENYRYFISQDKLYQCMKDALNISKISSIKLMSKATTSNLNNTEELSRLLASVCSHINTLVDKTYVNKGKINQTDSIRYLLILEDYFGDLLYRNKAERIANYMDHNPDFDFLKHNWKVHHNRLEYLIKQGKKHIQNILIPY